MERISLVRASYLTWTRKQGEKINEEQRRWEQTAPGKYGNIAVRFENLVRTCGSQLLGMARASPAVDFGSNTAADLVLTDVLVILSVVARVKPEVPTELGKLLQALTRKSETLRRADCRSDGERGRAGEFHCPY